MKKKYLTWKSFKTASELVFYINGAGYQEESIQAITHNGKYYKLFVWKWY